MKKRSILKSHIMIGKYRVKKLGEGKGTFGNIHLVTDSETKDGEVFALKKINLGICDVKDKQHCHDEVKHLKELNHRHVVKYIDSFEQDRNLCIVMEYCKGGNLRQFIQKHEQVIGEDLFVKLLTQICEGLKYLHSLYIAHRDIKTTNILLTEDSVIKIADFGLARIMGSVTCLTKAVGSPYFMSPEMLAGQDYTIKTDIWSLGCCMYEMGTKSTLFSARDETELRQKVHNAENIPLLAEALPYRNQVKELFCAMLKKDSKDRPTTCQILEILTSHSHLPVQMKRSDFSKTCPARLSMDDSGVHEPEASRPCTGFIEVYLTVEQKEYLDQIQGLEGLILNKLDGNKDIMKKIHSAISDTKDMERETEFLASMETLLGQDMYNKCRLHLQPLWSYRRELLKEKFQMV